jgi:hypothetical protein
MKEYDGNIEGKNMVELSRKKTIESSRTKYEVNPNIVRSNATFAKVIAQSHLIILFFSHNSRLKCIAPGLAFHDVHPCF